MKITVTKPFTVAGLKGSPAADTPNKQGVLLKFTCTGTSKTFGLWVPAINDDEITAGVFNDTNDGALYRASLLTGESQVTLQDSHGNALSAFLSGEQRNRK